MNGEDGLDRDRGQPGGAAGDVVDAQAPTARTSRFDRTNLVPFGSTSRRPRCSSSTAPAATTRSTTAPGLGALIAVVADGGSGNDTLTGGDEADTFFGGLGDDTLDPRRRPGDAARRPGRRRHAAGPRRLRRPRPRRRRHRHRAGRPRGRARPTSRTPTPPPAAAGGRHHGHGGARDDQARHVEAQERASTPRRSASSCPASEAGGCKGTLVLQTARTVVARRHDASTRSSRASATRWPAGRPRPSRSSCPRASARSAAAARSRSRHHHEPRRGGQPRPALLAARDQAGPLAGSGARAACPAISSRCTLRGSAAAACGASSCRRRPAPTRSCCRRSSGPACRAGRRAASSSRTGVEQLDARVEVARHQVGRADVDRVVAVALEGVDPRVLEEAADDRDDADVLRHARARPACRQQMPRMLISTGTPACEAR